MNKVNTPNVLHSVKNLTTCISQSKDCRSEDVQSLLVIHVVMFSVGHIEAISSLVSNDTDYGKDDE